MNRIFSLFVFIAIAALSLSYARADVNTPTDASPLFKEQVRKLIDGYSEIKNALVTPDPKSAQAGAQKLIKVLRNFDVTKVTPEEKAVYEAAVQKIAPAAGQISNTTDLEVQRTNFKEVSNSMVQLIIANRTTVPDEDGKEQPASAIAAEELTKPRLGPMAKAVVLYEENEKKICLRYCPLGKGYFISEKGDMKSPYVGKEKQH